MKHQSVTDFLSAIHHRASTGDFYVHEMIDHLGHRGHWLLMFFLCLPFVQPIPMMGLSTVFGALIFGAGLGLLLNKPPWVPNKIANKKLPANLVSNIATIAHKLFVWIEKFSKVRVLGVLRNHVVTRISGLVICVLAILLALPLPIPGTNTIPVIPVLLLSLGHLERDGLLVLLGLILSLISISVFIALFLTPVMVWS